ncbi:NAD(P)-binding domain-containing protein [Streptomyces sp. ISL-43]|uniref:pyrroline-5-carboxylate reductase family protein n=1 Tax=Streptomyces sp. ISL-43 TaxID=2819183 RepID=UPI001BE651D1|nr:NAD(P)-binding domain-containing protein [Streptomyces sp. ISL-43]MBT2450398.1 NAD(P)-binding domain-containing protein [Streptomyces sp. ISL-43]
MQRRIVVIGAGHMGSVIVHGLRRNLPDVPLTVVEPSAERLTALRQDGIDAVPQYVPHPGDVTVLAIPPQALAAFAAGQPPGTFHDVTLVSVMAGVPTAILAALLGAPHVVRAMPNVASQVSEGMTVMYAADTVTPEARALAERALTSIGRVLVVDDERLLDDATALAGGGPAASAIRQEFAAWHRELTERMRAEGEVTRSPQTESSAPPHEEQTQTPLPAPPPRPDPGGFTRR